MDKKKSSPKVVKKAENPREKKSPKKSPKSPMNANEKIKLRSPVTSPDAQRVKLSPPDRELAIKIANTISGQLAILFEDKGSDMVAIPINFYNKSGKVVLGIERSPIEMVWGARMGQWIEPVVSPIGPKYPHGLNALISVNKVFISHFLFSKYQMNEEDSRKIGKVLALRNETGLVFLCAKERVNSRIRFVYGNCRQTDIKLYDPFKREVLFCRQLLRFNTNMFCCYLQCMEVMAQPGKLIGRVRQQWALCGKTFCVEDHNGNTLFLMKQSWSNSQIFTILSTTQKSIGEIKPSLIEGNESETKELPILSVNWTQSLNPIDKALLISASFLIKFLFYDK